MVADSDGPFGHRSLARKASVTLKSSTDIIIYGLEDIFAPEDSIGSLAAALVSVLDTAGNFTAINVETVLGVACRATQDKAVACRRARTRSAQIF